MYEIVYVGIGFIIGWTGAVTFIKLTQKKLLGDKWEEFNKILNKEG